MTMFVATFSAVVVSAQQDLFEITAPSTGVVQLHEVVISQSSDAGDVQEQLLLIQVKRGQTTTGSGGSILTPVATDGSPATFSGAVKANNTTKASVGTISTVHAEAWNVRGSWPWTLTPECRIWLPPSVRATVELATTPGGAGGAVTASGTMLFELLGA